MRRYYSELHIFNGFAHQCHSSGSFMGSDTLSMAKLMATYRAILNEERIVGPRWRLHQPERAVGDIEGRVYLKQRRTRPGVKNVNPKTYLFVGKKVSQ